MTRPGFGVGTRIKTYQIFLVEKDGIDFKIKTTRGQIIMMDYLPKSQARKLYQFGQGKEEEMQDYRRQIDLENKRKTNLKKKKKKGLRECCQLVSITEDAFPLIETNLPKPFTYPVAKDAPEV